jgi:general secretion pathway protein G
MKRPKTPSKAFTLIEVLVVIAILVMLASAGVVGYLKTRERANKDIAKILVTQTADAVKLYQVHMNKYPDTDQGLQALITKPDDEKDAERWSGPYLEGGKIPLDPWRNELKYERLDQTADTTKPPFRVFSYGPDGQEGTDDDVSSYEESKNL